MTTELRTFTGGVEFRAAAPEQAGAGTATGYAYKFNSLSQDLGGFVETIAPGAGAASIASDDVAGLANHDPSLILGRTSSGTMSLAEDATGALYSIDLADTTVGRDWATHLERGDVTGSSFGFYVPDGGDEWNLQPDGTVVRTLLQFSLRDVGPVTFPAYLGATAALASLANSRSIDIGRVKKAAEANALADIFEIPLSPTARRMLRLRSLSRTAV